MLTLTAVGKSHGTRVLFRDVSLRVTEGRRLALVGANGVGKTTLLRIMAGLQSPDDGEVSRARDVQVGLLGQDVAESTGRSVLAETLAGVDELRGLEARIGRLQERLSRTPPGAEQERLLGEYGRLQDRFEHYGGYSLEAEARRVLAGLGFAEADMDADIGRLSGGWMMRVVLARLLLARPDVLLLDEPTNHLDLDSVAWLESFLADYEGAVVLVSHDRDFINGVANRVVELANHTATEYVGAYAAFAEARAQRLEQLRAAARNQERKVAHTQAFIDRFRYKASKARQVQSRIKQLDRLERVEPPQDRARSMGLRFPTPARAGRRVVELQQVSKSYGDRTVYAGLDLVIERGRKVALVGPNGAGKSTLLKILAGAVPFDSGRRRLGHNVTVAYFAQHRVEALHPDNTVLQEMQAALAASDADTSQVNPRGLLGAFLFSGEDVDKRVAVLSGGEKSRLSLAKLMADPANLLCLDEPTNHLDIAARDVLEDALAAYPGTVVLITHDRHLIRSVADTIVQVGGGGAAVHPGDFESYAARTGLDVDGKPQPGRRAPAAAPARAAAERKRAEAERRARVYRETRALRARLAAAEDELGRVEAEVAELTRHLADPGVYADGERVKRLVAEHNAAKDRAAALTSEWERLYLQVERATDAAEQASPSPR